MLLFVETSYLSSMEYGTDDEIYPPMVASVGII